MVSYKIVLGIEENMDTKKHWMFSYEIITFKVLVLSKPSNTQNTFLVKLSFSGVWVLSKIFNAHKLWMSSYKIRYHKKIQAFKYWNFDKLKIRRINIAVLAHMYLGNIKNRFWFHGSIARHIRWLSWEFHVDNSTSSKPTSEYLHNIEKYWSHWENKTIRTILKWSWYASLSSMICPFGKPVQNHGFYIFLLW